MVNVLIVEDEAIVGLDLQQKLKKAGYSVPVVAGSAEEVFRCIQKCPPDVILMDIRIRGNCDGIELAEVIRQTSDLPIIFITGQGDEKTIERARRTLASGYLVKPVSLPTLRGSIEMAVYRNKTTASVSDGQEESLETIEKLKLCEEGDLDRLVTIVEGFPAAMMLVNAASGAVVYANPRIESLLGYERNCLVAEKVETLRFSACETGRALNLPSILLESTSDKPWVEDDFYLVRKNGERLVTAASFRPIVMKTKTLVLVSLVELESVKPAGGGITLESSAGPWVVAPAVDSAISDE